MLSENTMTHNPTHSNTKASHIATNDTKSNKLARSLMDNYQVRHLCSLLHFRMPVGVEC